MQFTYSKWRHGGWYVSEVRYPSGAVGCVSRNYPDGKWRIACDPRPFERQPTFKNRDAAAYAEYLLAKGTPTQDADPDAAEVMDEQNNNYNRDIGESLRGR